MRLYARLACLVLTGVIGVALAGCQSSRRGGDGTGILRSGIPPAAKTVAEGQTQLTYTPEEPGQVYLYDMTQDRVIGRFHLRRGQRFAMDGLAGRATIDGNEVRIGETKRNSNYQVYFLPAAIE
ncbi:MAG TPA: hypothetical protein VGR35_19035 [Tepidisphaeraceae bacterium]|nr:hypothetical protein [Tepidisphaeraceae bacterium]